MTSAEKMYRRVKRVAAAVLGLAVLAGLAAAARSFPDMRRYARIERM